MLLQFRFRNYRSFRDDSFLDFSASKITEYSAHVIQQAGEKILPVAAIFGANASGKSNVIDALRFMASYVMESFSYGAVSDFRQFAPVPFLLDAASRNEASQFEVYFTGPGEYNDKIFDYGFSVGAGGVEEEWLNIKARTSKEPRMVFYRGDDELDLSGLPAKSQSLIRLSLNKETLVVSLGAKLKISRLKIVYDWFSRLCSMNAADSYGNAFMSSFAEDRKEQKKVLDFLSSFDPSIIDFDIGKDSGDFRGEPEIKAIHHMIGGGVAEIPLESESAGTLKMFSMYPYMSKVLAEGGILMADELSSRLHPLLVRNILISFLDPDKNRNHAQLVFSSHDPWLLSNDQLRRDEIWFTEKDGNGISSLFSLSDFVDSSGSKIRKDESYGKNYLLGKYGAIPALKSIDMLTGGKQSGEEGQDWQPEIT